MQKSLLLAASVLALMTVAAAAQAPAALTGSVTSAKEGAMEGVVVTAKKDGFDHCHIRRNRQPGALQLSGRKARCRPLRAEDSRHWL